MLFNTVHLLFVLSISTLTNALPLDGSPRKHLIPRAKSYAIVNVDGGSTTAPQPEATTTVVKEKTKTNIVEITSVAPTFTDTVIIVEPTPTPAPTPASTPSPSSSRGASSTISPSVASPSSSQVSSTILPQPPSNSSVTPSTSIGPSIITVIITASEAVQTTEYYDNGLWHTYYAVKSSEAAAVTPVVEVVSSSTGVSSTSLAVPTI